MCNVNNRILSILLFRPAAAGTDVSGCGFATGNLIFGVCKPKTLRNSDFTVSRDKHSFSRIRVCPHCEIHFRGSCKKLRMHAAAPMWRNGRRNGLKIRSREKRGMGSTPIIGTCKNVVLLGKNVRIPDLSIANRRARKRTKTPSICQVSVK